MSPVNRPVSNEWSSRTRLFLLVKHFYWLSVDLRMSTKCFNKMNRVHSIFFSFSFHKLSQWTYIHPTRLHSVHIQSSELSSWFILFWHPNKEGQMEWQILKKQGSFAWINLDKWGFISCDSQMGGTTLAFLLSDPQNLNLHGLVIPHILTCDWFTLMVTLLQVTHG